MERNKVKVKYNMILILIMISRISEITEKFPHSFL